MEFGKLSGSDYFHLLIDRKMKRFGMAGNISRIHFELDKSTDLNAIAESVKQNSTFLKICSVRYKTRWPLVPVWFQTERQTENVLVTTGISTNEFETTFLNRKVDNDIGLVWIDLCKLENGSKHAVIAMHHALFDHQGMVNFIYALNDDFSGPFFRQTEPNSVWKMIVNAGQMNLELFKRSVWRLGSFFEGRKPQKLTPEYRTIQFTEDESKRISENAWKAGSKIGESTFHIGVVAQSVFSILKARNSNVPYLWFSIPHNQRKLGTKGHLLSNKLSFLFFRLNESELKSTKIAVSSILNQLKAQIKSHTTEKYVDLMKMMRFVPMPIYEKMVSVPSRGRLSSFGFSDLGNDQLTMNTFCGAQIKSVFRIPPIPSPPGFNVATVKTENGLQMMLAFAKELFTEQEIEMLVSGIRKSMLTKISDDA